MTKFAFVVLLIAVLPCSRPCTAQQVVKSTKVNDPAPDITFNTVVNHSKKSISLKEYRGKLLILDIWNKWCSPCIESFPKMEDIERSFPGKVKVVLVTENTLAEFQQLKPKSRIIRETKLPFVLEDTLIKKYFPHQGVPLHIWIDSAGIVKAVTNGYNTTKERIKEYFSSGTVNFSMRDRDILDFDVNQSLLTEGNGRQLPSLQQYSLLFGALPHYKFTTFVFCKDPTSGKRNGFRLINENLMLFLQLAYPKYTEQTIILDFPNSSEFIRPVDENKLNDFDLKYQFCYESRVPERYFDSIHVFRKILQEDILRFFNLSAAEEVRETYTYRLINTGSAKKLTAPHSSEQENIEESKYGIEIKKKNIQYLINFLAKLLDTAKNKQVILRDESKLTDINIHLNISSPSLTDINRELSKYGLKVIRRLEKVNFLVFRKKNS